MEIYTKCVSSLTNFNKNILSLKCDLIESFFRKNAIQNFALIKLNLSFNYLL